MANYPYENLDKHFTAPKQISFKGIRISRKLKKKVKSFCGVHWNGLNNGQRLWFYLGNSNNDYRRFLIKKLCSQYDN